VCREDAKKRRTGGEVLGRGHGGCGAMKMEGLDNPALML
jgi:hypothetical protein